MLRAADAVLGIAAPKSVTEGRMPVPGVLPFRPKKVCESTNGGNGLNLYWSDFDTAIQAKRLQDDCGITRRLNIAIEVISKFPTEDEGLHIVHIPMLDTFDMEEGLSNEWPAQLQEAIDLLRAWRDEGATVNVSCQMGKNRSGAVILLWLCSECGWELEAAVHHLRDMNPLACGNPHLLAAMCQVLGVAEVKVPLNPAADGGGWVCISPPGSPRAGQAALFDGGFAAGGAAEAAARLAALAGYSAGAPPQAPVEEEEESADGMEDLLCELDDVD